MRSRGASGENLQQSLTQLRVFVLASALVLVAGGALLGWTLTRTLHDQALVSERWALARYVDGVVRPSLVKNDKVIVTRWGSQGLIAALRGQPDVVTVKVWRADGVLAWTNRGQQRIGRRFPLDGPLESAIVDNKPASEFVSTTGGDSENAVERGLGFSQLLEVYAPIMGASSVHPIGAYEIYADPSSVDRLIGSRKRMLWTAVAVVFGVLWLLLVLLVRRASRLLQRQNVELREHAATLEESALEAVESLNATVDAKDPYTAGHSQRVQRIALALGAQLGLDEQRLDALRFAGLFHDIGKLGVPDAILTKPARLTAAEYDKIKRHPADGAKIVGRLHRLESAVPAILHHHERWDGRGYPDGLARDAIPIEAAVVGLADAWDAMTTERPYSAARTVEDAAEEIVRNNGTQFAPAVVEAFLNVLEEEPELLAPEQPTLAAALAL